ncbi:hypothetical protein JHK86_055593 [Glycine max]|nr:hypothetical protein JHK86_055593 [Glycine max]
MKVLRADRIEEENVFVHPYKKIDPHTFFDRMVDGPISESQAASLMRNLLEAIEYCHRLDVAHRDI